MPNRVTVSAVAVAVATAPAFSRRDSDNGLREAAEQAREAQYGDG